MQKTIISIIVLTLFCLANAQINFSGACPNRRVHSNLHLSSYSGRWYEYAKYPASFEAKSSCVTEAFSLNLQNEVNILKRMVNPSNGQSSFIGGDVKKISDSKFKYINLKTPSTYWVLSTDYISYAITYSCEPTSDKSHYTYVWILTRDRFPSNAIITKATNILSSIGIPHKLLTVTDQINC